MRTKPPLWPFITPPPVNPRILDNFGITMNLRMLGCWPEYAAAKRSVFGKGKLRRWWMRKVFPIIRPNEYTRRVAIFEDLQHKMRQELMNAVMEQRG
jgi:hypothetical protein